MGYSRHGKIIYHVERKLRARHLIEYHLLKNTFWTMFKKQYNKELKNCQILNVKCSWLVRRGVLSRPRYYMIIMAEAELLHVDGTCIYLANWLTVITDFLSLEECWNVKKDTENCQLGTVFKRSVKIHISLKDLTKKDVKWVPFSMKGMWKVFLHFKNGIQKGKRPNLHVPPLPPTW